MSENLTTFVLNIRRYGKDRHSDYRSYNSSGNRET